MTRFTLLLLTLLSCPLVASEPGQDTAALEAEAQALVQRFVGRLKPALQGALADGGPVNAIGVCADRAPAIAEGLSQSSGWLVRRVSLQARNASRAIPDAWETTVLEDFDRRRAAGEAPASINHGELQGSHYRYMQAQGVDGVCLLCHGTNLDPAVTAALADYYPDDAATGYLPGDVRGAISLSKARLP